MAHYGSACACCSEADPRFLTLDHINNDGAAHRREMGVKGSAFYLKIRRLGYPSGLQALCWNCNMGKALYGVCPHQKSTATT